MKDIIVEIKGLEKTYGRMKQKQKQFRVLI